MIKKICSMQKIENRAFVKVIFQRNRVKSLNYFKADCELLCEGFFIMSHSLLWRRIVLLTVGVYSSSHRVLYTIGISMTEISKKCRSVRPFVTLTKKAYSSFIIDSRKIILISDERVWHPLQENVAIFSKKYFLKILD